MSWSCISCRGSLKRKRNFPFGRGSRGRGKHICRNKKCKSKQEKHEKAN